MSENRPHRTLHDYRSVIAFRNDRGDQPIIVGGQAVNFWGDYYLESEPEIASFLPLTSKDLDLIGSVNDLAAIAKAIDSTYTRVKPGGASPVIGVINFKTSEGAETKIEILFSLYGLSDGELKTGVMEIYHPGLGLKIRLLGPAACLKAKIHNAIGIDQDGRQDLKHVKILMHCNRGFLRDILAEAASGRISERAAINAFEALLKFTKSTVARRAALKFHLNWSQAFPLLELQATKVEKLQKFFQQRLLKAFPTCLPAKS